MTQTTPTLALVKPGGGSTGLNTPADRVDIDVINANMDKIDVFATAVGPQGSQNKQFYGPAASLAGVVGHKLGDEYQESDGNKLLWRYDGANWVWGNPGSVVIRPTSIVAGGGGTGVINPDGTVSYTGVNGIALNGVFSPQYREYEISWSHQRSIVVTDAMRLRAAGADASTAVYVNRRQYSTGAGVVETGNTVGQYEFGAGVGANSAAMNKTIRLFAPATAEYTKVLTGYGFESDGSSIGSLVGCQGEHRLGSAYDGFILFVSSGAITGKLRVVGFV